MLVGWWRNWGRFSQPVYIRLLNPFFSFLFKPGICLKEREKKRKEKGYIPKSHQLERRDGNTDQDRVADVEGHVAGLIDGGKVEASAEDASEGEDDHEAPAGRFADAMANGEENGDGEGGNVEYEEENGDAVTVVHCHCSKDSGNGQRGENEVI